MAIFDAFFKRQRRARGEMPDVFVYDELPERLRAQIVFVLQDVFGSDRSQGYFAGNTDAAYHEIQARMCREIGRPLVRAHVKPEMAVIHFITEHEDVEEVLSLVEIALQLASERHRDGEFMYTAGVKAFVPDAVNELNARFLENGVGYQIEDLRFVRQDSEFAHQEVMRPALSLLREKGFAGANDEFLKAHRAYRENRPKDVLTECGRALESALKTICSQRKWPFNERDTASRLIDIVFEKGLIPAYLQSEFSALRSTLESGIPTVRNREGAHGQGEKVRDVPPYLPQYLLNLTAAAILLLVQAHTTQRS